MIETIGRIQRNVAASARWAAQNVSTSTVNAPAPTHSSPVSWRRPPCGRARHGRQTNAAAAPSRRPLARVSEDR